MEKVVYKVDYFVDFNGQTRQVIMAAVSSEVEGDVSISSSYNLDDIVKEVRLGISVQNPHDVRLGDNVELGKIIALGKAKKDKSCFGKIFSTDKGFINHSLVDAWLAQEMNYFQQNPGKYIKGYNKDKELFEKSPLYYTSKYDL